MDPALLQQALDAALEAAPYYRVRLVWEKRKAFLEPNSEPCLVYPDSVMREMPEQTNGYFFALHCAQNTVYFRLVPLHRGRPRGIALPHPHPGAVL